MKRRENVSRRRAFVFYKLLAVVFAALVALSACGKRPDTPVNADDSTTQPRPAPTETLRAPYTEEDSLNPYYCASYLNACLMPLAFETLFTVDRSGNITVRLAGSYTEEAESVLVSIPVGSRFSDGTELTSADVVYSYGLAKKSEIYQNALVTVDGAEAVSPYEVRFAFTDRFPARVGALTFPIVKQGTAETKGSIPVGSGRYRCDMTESGPVFHFSENYRGDPGSVAQIVLVDVDEVEKLTYMLTSGDIDLFMTDHYGTKLARVAASSYSCPQNALIYLGVNSKTYLADPILRRALSNGIDRNEIAGSVYSASAEPAVLPMRHDGKLVTLDHEGELSAAVDYSAAAELLKEGGYAPAAIPLTILVNSESVYKQQVAECIVSSLGQLGIAVGIRSLEFEEYMKALKNEDYQLFLGEVKLPDSGALDVFFGGAADLGIAEDSPARAAYRALCDGSGSPAAFISSFLEDMPFISLCFRNDLLYCRNGIVVPENAVTLSNAFADIALWQVAPVT